MYFISSLFFDKLGYFMQYKNNFQFKLRYPIKVPNANSGPVTTKVTVMLDGVETSLIKTATFNKASEYDLILIPCSEDVGENHEAQ